MGLFSDLITIGANLLDANRVHPALVAAVQHHQAQGYYVQYLSERSATLVKDGMLWNSTVTLQVGEDGRVHKT